jgi:predicted CoA-substrate-specific enzyme activase
MGANVPLMLYEECAARFGFEIVHVNHCITKSHPREEGFDALRTGTEEYAAYFLRNIRCPRMCGEGYRKAIREEMKEKGITALIFNVLKFCDFQPFDHKCFSEEPDVPVLAIEHELTANYEGQIMTRIEAFFEHLRGRNGGRGRKTGGRYFVGIDSGSHATKLVCIDSERRVVARDVVPTGTSVRGCAEELVSRLRNVHGIAAGGIARTIATGYGRNEIKIADDAVTEITCHALGAHHILGREATIIDIGGQDSKAIKISKDGAVVRFAMNDKCAAGTGRFLEVMAAKLGMEIGGFAELALRASEHVPISSMCSVFAESEVISLIASGRTREEIAKGIHMAIAERTAALARRIGGAAPYYMAGGVARNKALVAGISACLGDPVSVIVHPQFSGALGAAIIAGGG